MCWDLLQCWPCLNRRRNYWLYRTKYNPNRRKRKLLQAQDPDYYCVLRGEQLLLRKMPAELTIEGLLEMTPMMCGIDTISMASRELFVSYLKTQPSVHEVFFPEHLPDPHEEFIHKSWFDFDPFACLFVSHALSENKDSFKVCTMLNAEVIDQKLADFYCSPDWKKIGFALYTLLFPDLVKDKENGTPFKDYMESDRQFWAGKICEKIKDPQWIYNIVRPIVKGQCTDSEYNRDMNILFVKLHLLDPPSVMPAYHHLRKALPDLNLELVTTNYLGEPFDWKMIQADIEKALDKATKPRNSSRLSLDQVELYHGVQVIEFIMQEARELGLWSGKYADNRRLSGIKDRCSLM